ncbi:MAG: MMPL family transporter [Actinobacteria bacterium]|nr:MMPL family transporter [Actinomycetota bacterium]
MRRLTDFVLAHKRWVVAFWVAVLLFGVPNLQRATRAFSQEFSVPGRQGYETNRKLLHLYGIDPNTSSIVAVFRLPATDTLGSPRARRELGTALLNASRAVPGVQYLSFDTTGGSKAFLSADRRTTFAVFYPRFKKNRGFGGPSKEIDALRAALQKHHPAGWTVNVTGIDALSDSGGGGSGPGVLVEALLGGLGALIVLAFVFASFIALVPLVMAVFAIVATFMLMWALTLVASVSFIVQFLVALIGLGVCIDYALLLVVRWREEHANGHAGEQAVRRAMDTAGRAIVFSGTTVGIGLLSLVVLPVPFLRSIGYAGMLIPIVSVLVATTLLPVILATIGERLDWPRIRTERDAPRFWVWWSRWIVRWRWIAAGVALAILIALAIPALRIQIGNASPDSLAKTGDARAGLVALEQSGIGAGALTEYVAVAPVYDAYDVATKLARVSGVRGAAVAPWRSLSSPDVVVAAFPDQEANGGFGRSLYNRLKEAVAPLKGVGIGGQVAGAADFVSAVYSNFPLMIALIAVLTLLLLARAFRSILLPLKAIVLNLLSVAAAWGVLVLVWQEGHGSSLIWGIKPTHAITAFIPLMVFAFLFGLSMDYEVFILSRVREEYDATGSTDEAVVVGLSRTGRLVTSAALILFLAFAALGSGPEVVIKIFATGLAAGIILDATVVRALLVPALVSLFGKWNWWLPRFARPELGSARGADDSV